MRPMARILSAVLLLVLATGCSKLGGKSPAQLGEEYTAKAQQYEAQGDLVEALEQYKLALTVDPENQLAKEKKTTIEEKLYQLAEEHYQIGLRFYKKGQYGQARKEFLTALRYDPEHAEAKDKLTTTKTEIEQVKRYIVHTVQPDESISTLARLYYGDYRKFHLIAEYNELEDATKVTVGQKIKIPVIEGIPIIADPAAIQTATGESPESMPVEVITVKRFITHTVQPGESLSKLAQIYYGDYKKFDLISKFNSLEDGINLKVGQEIKIPEVEGVPFLAKDELAEPKVASIPKDLPAVEEKAEKQTAEAANEKQKTEEDQTLNYRELGIELYKNKEYEDAITEFNKVLNVNPNDKTALNYLSLAYFELGQRSFEKKAYVQAIKNFEASSNNNPDDSKAREYLAKSHFQQGLVLFGKEDYLAARDEFTAARNYNKDCDQCDENIRKCEDTYKQIHYDKGLAYFGNQKLAEAIHEWELVSELDSNYKDVTRNLTKAKALLERLESIKRSKTQETQQ